MAGLDDRISVHVQNFKTLLKQANGNCQGIVLFLDGMPIKADKAESCDPVAGHIRYRLLRDKDEKGDETAWHSLLGSPDHYTRQVSVSVGSDQQFSIPSTATNFRLEVIPKRQFLLFMGLIALSLGIFIYLCRTTSLIRGGSHPVPHERPYSLSLFQMSFWFFLVIAAYIFMWLITDELDTITESVLALIGIGAATALAATLIDRKKDTPQPDEPGGTSKGFLNDVMSDPTGVSLHRFQMFVWTLVLGVIFCGNVFKNLEMPQFSATLLGLMGISSGTYLGFKVPEKKGSDTPAGDLPDPQPQKPPSPTP
jgi:predicted membrane channel-forming protein YqfA (hemolysin III family)